MFSAEGRSKRQLIIFDFDGTLADTLPVFVDVFDQAADKYGFRRLDRNRQHALRQLPKIRKVLAATGVAREHTLLVGDEIRDAKVSAEAGIDFGAVAWGFNHIEALLAEQPAHVFRQVDELLA